MSPTISIILVIFSFSRKHPAIALTKFAELNIKLTSYHASFLFISNHSSLPHHGLYYTEGNIFRNHTLDNLTSALQQINRYIFFCWTLLVNLPAVLRRTVLPGQLWVLWSEGRTTRSCKPTTSSLTPSHIRRRLKSQRAIRVENIHWAKLLRQVQKTGFFGWNWKCIAIYVSFWE